MATDESSKYEKDFFGGLIKTRRIVDHSKASEKFIEATFVYQDGHKETKMDILVPIEYRRADMTVKDMSEQTIEAHLRRIYETVNPERHDEWLSEEKKYWAASKASVTEGVFKSLADNEWKCTKCGFQQNSNLARRIQDIKDRGYVIVTKMDICSRCNSKTKLTHYKLLQIERGSETGYETISKELKERILRVLRNIDVFENRARGNILLPDHKFPEIRWTEEYARDNDPDMTEDEIRNKFQLLDNKRNEQKREVCRRCFQTGKRGYPYGIKYYYEGSEDWPDNIPKKGKEAEKGCVGCGWYDLAKWRDALNETILELED